VSCVAGDAAFEIAPERGLEVRQNDARGGEKKELGEEETEGGRE